MGAMESSAGDLHDLSIEGTEQVNGLAFKRKFITFFILIDRVHMVSSEVLISLRDNDFSRNFHKQHHNNSVVKVIFRNPVTLVLEERPISELKFIVLSKFV